LARGVVVNTATKISNLVHTTRFWNNIFQAQYQTIGKTNNYKVVGSKKNKNSFLVGLELLDLQFYV
jgi:hypothetical protein